MEKDVAQLVKTSLSIGLGLAVVFAIAWTASKGWQAGQPREQF